jgi:hypothetical protein
MKNFIDWNGDEIKNLSDGYIGCVMESLKEKLPEFDEYTFILYGNNDSTQPVAKHFKHPNKVLIWQSNENKNINLKRIEGEFVHTFANYHWDTKNITSIPLGYATDPKSSDAIPLSERLFNISFVGCLNRNRVGIASRLTGINSTLIGFGLTFCKKFTLKVLNTICKYRYFKNLYHFNPDFNSGVDSERYSWILKHSKIALVPCGWVNSETFRLYEAMRYGCVIICEELPYREYYKGIPAIIVQDWNEGLEVANNLLNEPVSLEMLSDLNKKFYEEKLSPAAAADIILNKLKNK